MLIRRRAGVWKWVLASIGGLFMLGLCFVALMTSVTGSRWQRYAAAVRATGQPLSYAEIESKRDMIPDDQNGALVVARLIPDLDQIRPTPDRRYVLKIGRKADELNLFDGVPRHVADATRLFVGQQKELLGQMAAIDKRPRGRFMWDYNSVDPTATLLPHLFATRQAARLEYVATAVALWDGDPSTALQHIRRIFHLAGALHQEPGIFSRLGQLEAYSVGVEAVEGFLRFGEFDDEVLLELDNILGEQLPPQDIRWALLGERAMYVELFESMAKGRLGPNVFNPHGLASIDSATKVLPFHSLNFVMRSNQLVGARLYTSMIDVAHDFPKLLAACQAANTKVRGLSVYHGVVCMRFPDFVRAVELNIESKCLIESARCALATERYRLNSGLMPSLLEILVPDFLEAVPLDPFGDGTLQFKLGEDGVTIYSQGSNRADDGGDVVPRGRAWEFGAGASDVGFRLIAPAKRGVVILDLPPPEDDE